jgi:ATP-dependent protease HslVU (ClpYQ) peptidase subunit
MTCIVGIVKDKRVWIGGDSAGIGGYTLTLTKQPKIFKIGQYLIGYTTSFRMGQILEFGFTPPKPNKKDLLRFMVVDFVDALRKRFKDAGFFHKEDGQDRGGTFLVGVAGRLFRIADDFQIFEAAEGYSACGCGEEVALGALYVAKTLKLKPRDSLRLALEAASSHNTGVAPPFSIQFV